LQHKTYKKEKYDEEITFTIGFGLDHFVNECPRFEKRQQLKHRQD
jgi:hypothetical protein